MSWHWPWPWRRGDGATGCFELGEDATLRVRPGRHGAVLRAERGVVLVTQAGDPEDHVLAAGEEVRLGRGGLIVAQAFEAARLVVRAGVPGPDASRGPRATPHPREPHRHRAHQPTENEC